MKKWVIRFVMIGVIVGLMPAVALANHPVMSDSGIDIPWTNDMNQESFWETYFGGPGLTVECTKFSEHNGQIPSQYEAAVVKSGSEFVRVYVDPPSQVIGPPNPNDQHPNKRYESPFSWVTKCNIDEEPEPELIKQEIFVLFECLVRQGVGLPLFSVEGRLGAEFIVNGINVGGTGSGQAAQFGLNTWQAIALDGYVVVGETSGEEIIEDCTPATTTTTTTTNTQPDPLPNLVVDPPMDPTIPPTTPSTPTTLSELPFTGPVENLALVGLSGLAVLLLGATLVSGVRRKDES